jgi:hypothetical protein
VALKIREKANEFAKTSKSSQIQPKAERRLGKDFDRNDKNGKNNTKKLPSFS